MAYKFFFVFGIIIIINSCNNEKNELKDNIYINLNIDSLVSKTEPIKYSDFFSDYQFIPLETTNEFKIGGIGDVKIINDTIFIFDRKLTKKVYMVSMKGRLIGEIGRIGRGPGEYINSIDFDVSSNDREIALLDISLLRLNFYNYDGAYIRSIPFHEPFQNFVIVDESIIFFRPPLKGIKPNEKLIYLYDHSGNEIASLKKNNEIPQYSFMGQNYLFKTNNNVRFYMPFNDTIFTINMDGVNPFISLDSKTYKLTKDERVKLNSKPGYFPSFGVNKLFNIRNYSENDELCFFNFNIGLNYYYTFHYFESNKTLCSTRFTDDITFISPVIFSVTNNLTIGIIDYIDYFPRLKEVILEDKLELSNEEKDRLLKACHDYSPILVLYKLKNR